MPTPYDDRWERTKRYLLRNFLVSPGFQLSPIPEEDRSSPDSDSGSLPDLIVEPAPDRHDHGPGFYDGLERRMRRLYRQLFLGANESDLEDSSDFEVNQSMTSTFILNFDAGKDNEANNKLSDENIGSELNSSMRKEKQLTNSSIDNYEHDARVNTDGDKLIDTYATYNETSRVSIDDSNKSSSVEDEENRSIESISKSNETEDNVSIHEDNDIIQNVNKDRQNLTKEDRLHYLEGIVYGRLQTIEEESEIIETKSLSEDSAEQCYRVSTTVAQVHEPPKGAVQFDNGSPVLIPRLLQFGRTVFGTRDVRRFSGQSIHILNTSDENINQLPTAAEELNKNDVTIEEPETDVQRLLTASEYTRIRIDKTIDTQVLVNVAATQKDQEDVVTKSHEVNAEDNIQVSGNDIDKEEASNGDRQDKTAEIPVKQNSSIDWNKDEIDDDENWFDNAVKKGVFTRKARKFILQSSDEESIDENLHPIAHSTISEDVEPVEVMRDARESRINVSWHGEAEQASPVMAFEAKTSADRPDDISSDSNEINASLKETENEIEEEEMESEIGEAEETGHEIEGGGNEIEEAEEIENEIEEGEELEVEVENEIEEAEKVGNEINEGENEIEEAEEIGNEIKEGENEIEEEDEIVNEIEEGEEIEVEVDEIEEEEAEEQFASNPHDNARILDDFSPTSSTSNPHNNARTLEDFWSVSPIVVDIDDLPKETSSNKRRSDSNDDAPSSKRKKDMAIQTSSDDEPKWENVGKEFFVGSPLVFRLCGCKDHICS